MVVYKILANRQLAGYAGSDKYINVSSNETLSLVFDSILTDKIKTVNNEIIKKEVKGQTTNIHFNIVDKLLNTNYEVFFAKGTRELRLQLTNYVNIEKIIPGDIITLLVEILDSNCNIYIKVDSLYKYVLENKASENKYRILMEQPHNSSNCGITISEYTDDYLMKFNIMKLQEVLTFGKDKTEFNVYRIDDCNTKYIGIPYCDTLVLDCFNDIEEIL